MSNRLHRWRKKLQLTVRTAASDAREGLALGGLLMKRRGQLLARAVRDGGQWTGRHYRRPLLAAAAAVTASTWVLMAALALNLRFASAVLPNEPVDLWTANRPPSITVLSKDGEVIGQRGIRYADPVPLEELPPYAVDAFLATEDRRFFEHRGFDVRGLARAAIANWRAGAVVEGGSTITQQLAKNLFLSPEKTLTRKLEELQYALWLEARLTKEEILTLYLNRIYLGSGAYGIEAAARSYFSKSARDLTVAEAALIAGLPKAPSTLSPSINAAGAQERAQEVIQNLLEAGKIDPLTGGVAKRVPPELVFPEPDTAYGYFLDHVTIELKDRIGEFTDDVVVTTTLDTAVQKEAEAAIRAGINEEALARNAEQAALIAFDRQGGIAALVGGLDYEQSQFNRATQAKRQTGSAFKPFVFLAALEAGLSPDTLLVDQAIRVRDWAPRNYAETHRGPMRLWEAAARSTNSIAVQLTEAIGRDRVVDAAHRAGIAEPIPEHASIALGSVGMSLLDLAGAYLPFAHSGAERPAHAIAEVRTRRTGRVLYTFAPIDEYSVIEPAKADDTARLLAAVMSNGTGKSGQIEGHESAGKTGTTNDWRDAWFVGFTSHYTAGVWIGNDDNRGMEKVSGATIPLAIWQDFMTRVHTDLPQVPLFREEDADARRGASVRRVAGLYQSLRSDLFEIGYPLPKVMAAAASEKPDELRPRRRRNPFGRPRVEARAATRSGTQDSGGSISAAPASDILTLPPDFDDGFGRERRLSPGVTGAAAPGLGADRANEVQ